MTGIKRPDQVAGDASRSLQATTRAPLPWRTHGRERGPEVEDDPEQEGPPVSDTSEGGASRYVKWVGSNPFSASRTRVTRLKTDGRDRAKHSEVLPHACATWTARRKRTAKIDSLFRGPNVFPNVHAIVDCWILIQRLTMRHASTRPRQLTGVQGRLDFDPTAQIRAR